MTSLYRQYPLQGETGESRGGGVFSMRNIEFDVVPGSTAQSGTMEDRLNYFINMREDYAGDCECNLSIDGLVVRFDRTVNWGGNNTFTFDVVRMNAGTASTTELTQKTRIPLLAGISFSIWTGCRRYCRIISPSHSAGHLKISTPRPIARTSRA